MKQNKYGIHIGHILGGICFIPSFICCWIVCNINIILGIAILVLTEYLWLTSIKLCTKKLEEENRQLNELLVDKSLKEGEEQL